MPNLAPSSSAKLNSKRPRRSVWIVLLGLIVVGSLVGMTWILLSRSHFPIRRVEVYASYAHINPDELQAALMPQVAGAGFFGFSMHTVQRVLYALPWVESVQLNRVWPDTLSVAIKERHATGMWGQNGLIDHRGSAFYPTKSTFPKNLTQFSGPDGRLEEVLSFYTWLEQHPLTGSDTSNERQSITRLSLTHRGAWNVTLNGALDISLGKTSPKLKWLRLIAIYPQLITRQPNVSHIDLRYPQGVAVI